MTRYHHFLTSLAWICLALVLCSAAGTADAGVTLTDMAGRTVSVKQQANRIITTFKPATLCLLAIGLQDRLVGVDSSSRQDRLNLAVYPKIAEITPVGNKRMGLSYETVISLNPDLVILYSQKDGLALGRRLEKLDIPSIVIFPENFDTIKASLDLIARAAGVPERTQKPSAAMDRVLSLVAQRVAAIPPAERKKGYFASSLGLFSTTTRSMLQDSMFEKAGIINVSHELNGYFQDISPEQLMAWNPDIMVLSQHLKTSLGKHLNNPALAGVTAIAQKAVYRCPSSLAPWDFPSPLSAAGVLWMAQKAYPERFTDVDILSEIDRLHQDLFHQSMTRMGGALNDTLDLAGE